MAAGLKIDPEQLVKALKSNRFETVEYVETGAEALERILAMIPPGASVGIPGSTSVRQLGTVERLMARGNPVANTTAAGQALRDEVHRKAAQADFLITSANALTLDGKLVNIDGTGNRVSAMIYGPRKIILVIGLNKVVRDVNEALDRIKNVIAPYHGKARNRKTPCAVTGSCNDCASPDRMCNVTTIIEKRPRTTDITIILVGEDLGLGWDPTWPKERIDKITAAYRGTLARLE